MDPSHIKPGGLEALCQLGAADYAMMARQKSTVDTSRDLTNGENDSEDTSKDTSEDTSEDTAHKTKETVEPGGPEALCQLGAADYAMMAKLQKKLDLDLQNDHIDALKLIMDGMIRRNLSRSEIRKNISVFFSRVECFYRHYCLALEELSLDDLEKFKF